MFTVLCDPAIYEFENEPPESLEALRERFRRLESRRSPNGREQWLNWVVRQRDDGAAVGYVQATVFADGCALIAYEFGSAWWGRGLAREAVAALIDRLRSGHGARAVGAVFKRSNVRSRRLLERLGLRAPRGGDFPSGLAGADEDAMVLAADRPPNG
jgi:RimJ/RimL family protein N-acetyltransferase